MKVSVYLPDDMYRIIRLRLAKAIESGEALKQNDIIVDLLRHGLEAVRKEPEWRDILTPPDQKNG